MKRFVTYLYECERGNKTKNVGFIRINVRGAETTMEVYIRNVARTTDAGKLFVLIDKKSQETKGLLGIELVDVMITNGQSDAKVAVQTENIKGKDVSLNDIVGVGIRLDSGLYIASCWRDAQADEIVRGEFVLEESIAEAEEQIEPDDTRKETLVAAEESASQSEVAYRQELPLEKSMPTYEKIDLAQIRDLPSPNWYLATNSFLVHGFWNYGYLVLKKEMEEGEEILSLGVPGIFEKPEAVMATLFGFPSFEVIEKNQEAKEGTFGCWFVNLKV